MAWKHISSCFSFFPFQFSHLWNGSMREWVKGLLVKFTTSTLDFYKQKKMYYVSIDIWTALTTTTTTFEFSVTPSFYNALLWKWKCFTFYCLIRQLQIAYFVNKINCQIPFCNKRKSNLSWKFDLRLIRLSSRT